MRNVDVFCACVVVQLLCAKDFFCKGIVNMVDIVLILPSIIPFLIFIVIELDCRWLVLVTVTVSAWPLIKDGLQ